MSGEKVAVHAVVAFARDDSVAPRVRRRGRVDTYWRTILVLAASARRFAPGLHVHVVIDRVPPQWAEPFLDRWQVTRHRVTFSHRPPADYFPKWRSSHYLFDAMNAMAVKVGLEDVVMFVDPDVVWVNPVDPLADTVRAEGLVGYDLGYGPDHLCNTEVTRRQLGRLFAEAGLAPPVDDVPTYFGGEFYGFTGSELVASLELVEELWGWSIARHRAGRPRFTTEEHVMAGLLWARGVTHGGANHHIKRIWSAPPPHNNLTGGELDLVAWHLLQEKNRGFPRLFRAVSRPSAAFWQDGDEAARRVVARSLGVERAGLRRLDDQLRPRVWAIRDSMRGR